MTSARDGVLVQKRRKKDCDHLFRRLGVHESELIKKMMPRNRSAEIRDRRTVGQATRRANGEHAGTRRGTRRRVVDFSIVRRQRPHTRRRHRFPLLFPEIPPSETSKLFSNCGELAPQLLINGSTTTQRVRGRGTGIIFFELWDWNHFFHRIPTLWTASGAYSFEPVWGTRRSDIPSSRSGGGDIPSSQSGGRGGAIVRS